MSPEAATTRPWRRLFEETYFKSNLALLAIDEAHCITEWSVLRALIWSPILTKIIHVNRGKDFRKSFSILGDLRALTKAPVLSMTASAPPHVETELVKLLHLKNPVLGYTLQDDLSGIAQSLTSNDPASIPKTVIFFKTKELLIKAYVYLQNRAYCKHYVGAYHSSLTDGTKHFTSTCFSSTSSEMRCICSTITFGMVSM